MSALSQEPLAFGVREQHALGHLREALREALRRNRPIQADAQLQQQELVQLAVRLCEHDRANAAVVAGPAGGVIFVPI